jgi:hypothetical protein
VLDVLAHERAEMCLAEWDYLAKYPYGGRRRARSDLG